MCAEFTRQRTDARGVVVGCWQALSTVNACTTRDAIPLARHAIAHARDTLTSAFSFTPSPPTIPLQHDPADDFFLPEKVSPGEPFGFDEFALVNGFTSLVDFFEGLINLRSLTKYDLLHSLPGRSVTHPLGWSWSAAALTPRPTSPHGLAQYSSSGPLDFVPPRKCPPLKNHPSGLTPPPQ